MQETVRRVAAGALGLLTAGATLLAPSFAAADLSSFANMKPSDTVIVVGANAITQDVVGAINIGGALAQHGATSTSVGATVSTVTGGVKVESIGQKLYLATPLNTSFTRRVTSSDMPTVLADGTVTDNETTEIKYTQQIQVGQNNVTYNRPSSDITTPLLNLQMPTNAGPVLTMKVIFGNAVTYGKLAGKTVNIFGKDYTFASATADLTTTRLVLYGGGEALVVTAGGDTKTVVLDGSQVTLKMTSWTSANEAVIEINGVGATYAQGSYISVAGHDSKIYVKKVVVTKTPSASGGAGESAYAELFAGSNKLVLGNGLVATGKNEDTLNGAASTVTTTSITVTYAPTESGIYVADGATYKEPIFGAVKFAFTGVSPTADSTARQKVVIKQDGSSAMALDFPSATGAVTLDYAYHNSSSNYLADRSGNLIQMNETTPIARNQYFVIGNKDTGSRVMQVTSFSVGSTANTTAIKDLGTGVTTTYTYSSDASANALYVQGVPFLYTVTFNGASPSLSTMLVDAFGDGTAGNQASSLQSIYTKDGNAQINISTVGDLGASGSVNVTVREDPSQRVSTFTKDTTLKVESVYTGGTTNRYGVNGKTSAVALGAGVFVDQGTTLIQSGSTEEYTAYSPWGTYVKATGDTTGITNLELRVPSEPAVANVYVLENSAAVPASGAVSGGSGTVSQPSLAGGISKVDSAVTAADKSAKNVILVGGPAANALVAELASQNKTHDLNYWMANLQGKYVIQAVENAFATGKTAIVVAGYEYAQTQTASLRLATESLTGAKIESA